jgi:DNA adenine methylase
LIPEFTGTYYEPFLGTGAEYLHLLPEKAVLNDLNKDIVNIWKLVRSYPGYIIQEIEKFKKTFLHLDNVEKLKMCKELVSKMDTLKGKERTVLYLIMIYCSFNGCITPR